MRRLSLCVALLTSLSSTHRSFAQSPHGGGARLLPVDTRRFGIEASALYPFVAQALQVKTTWTLYRLGPMRGELVSGALVVFDRADEEATSFTEIDGILGYRHAFWRGLHAELSAPIGYARQRSAVDGRLRRAFVVNVDALIGYRFDLAWERFTLYANAQAGLGLIAYVSNPWPERNAFRNGEPYLSANVALGVRF